MKDSELQFDRTCHVLYSRPCKRQIQGKIALHYPQEQREEIWERVQRQYIDGLSDWRTDLGGTKNFHNGVGGTYDCIALMSYYTVCEEVTSLTEIEEMEGELFLPAFRKLRFADCNKRFWKRLMYQAFASSRKKCGRWGDYQMSVAPYEADKPIYYEFTACPVAEFARQHGLLKVMPALCNPDYKAMELIHAKLVRTTTCANGCKCDYTVCGDRDEYAKAHPEYVDEQGYRRNW
ncbi:MAG: L-2-amino-thiazoline-4-carboxylic acid hydrolase [Eubacteriales bacterium]|nr:L-2-amino-thiazoline-4-carboxylic acid hydrolase [Eubacteriales bacterium]